MERQPIQHAAGALAASAFIAVTQILTRTELDLALIVALTIFATTPVIGRCIGGLGETTT